MGGFEASNKVAVVLFLLIKALSIFKLREIDIVVEVGCCDCTFFTLCNGLDEEGYYGKEAVTALEE